MRDPRIDELLEKLDETDDQGNPTRRAEMAERVKGYLTEVEKLRAEIEIATRQVVYLTGREQDMKIQIEERAEDRKALINDVQDAKIESVVLRADGPPSLEKRIQASKERLVEVEQDFEYQRERLETVTGTLRARRRFVKSTQDLIAMRMNGIQQILEAFTKMSAEGDRPQSLETTPRDGTAAGHARTRKVRRVRVIRRRR
ncbi:MAG: hypothetical protein WD333_13030 [Dehalococcoidia bacterium]